MSRNLWFTFHLHVFPGYILTIQMMQILPLNRWLKALLFLLFWSVLGFAFAGQLYLSSYFFGGQISWREALHWSLADWYVWALLSVPIWWLASRVPFQREVWQKAFVVHLAGSIFAALIYMLLRAWIGQLQGWWEGNPVDFQSAFLALLFKTVPFNLMIYWILVAVCQAVQFYRRLQWRTLRAADLEKRLTHARLLALQMQLNPHFLFNTLHAISSLMHKNVEAAERMVILLSELLRHALDKTEKSIVTLEDELELLDRYLEIEQIRFGNRLRVEHNIPPDAMPAKVPNLLLQPLVENAIQYAVEPVSRPATIQLNAAISKDSLEFWVIDDGPGMPSEQDLVEGIGLSNIRGRLQQLYGKNHEFRPQNRSGGGFQVYIRIPVRT